MLLAAGLPSFVQLILVSVFQPVDEGYLLNTPAWLDSQATSYACQWVAAACWIANWAFEGSFFRTLHNRKLSLRAAAGVTKKCDGERGGGSVPARALGESWSDAYSLGVRVASGLMAFVSLVEAYYFLDEEALFPRSEWFVNAPSTVLAAEYTAFSLVMWSFTLVQAFTAAAALVVKLSHHVTMGRLLELGRPEKESAAAGDEIEEERRAGHGEGRLGEERREEGGVRGEAKKAEPGEGPSRALTMRERRERALRRLRREREEKFRKKREKLMEKERMRREKKAKSRAQRRAEKERRKRHALRAKVEEEVREELLGPKKGRGGTKSGGKKRRKLADDDEVVLDEYDFT
ncbi:MAG: hypothetical protein Kow0069_23730 [Promethearchaeota archaeon]